MITKNLQKYINFILYILQIRNNNCIKKVSEVIYIETVEINAIHKYSITKINIAIFVCIHYMYFQILRLVHFLTSRWNCWWDKLNWNSNSMILFIKKILKKIFNYTYLHKYNKIFIFMDELEFINVLTVFIKNLSIEINN